MGQGFCDLWESQDHQQHSPSLHLEHFFLHQNRPRKTKPLQFSEQGTEEGMYLSDDWLCITYNMEKWKKKKLVLKMPMEKLKMENPEQSL